MFSREFIDEVKEKVNLVDLISEYTALSKAGTLLYQGRCPHPDHNDSSPSFRIFKKGYKNGKKINTYDTWACMGCHCGSKTGKNSMHVNYGSDCFSFYQWMHGGTWKEAVYAICEKYNIPIPETKFDALFKKRRKQADSFAHNLYSAPRQYLYDRGITDKEIESWKLGFNGEKIVFPLMDRYKNVIGFTNRWLVVPEGRKDKYKNSKNSEIFNKSSYFYGVHNLDSNFNEIRITEGPMDVIVGHKYGVKNLNATLGTAFTDEHVDMIAHLGMTPVLIMDGDERGIEAGERAIEKLAEKGIYSKILILPGGKDLCDLSLELKDDIEDYINMNAMTYGQYRISHVINRFDSTVNELKLKHFKEIKSVLEEIPLEEERMIMKEYVLKRMDMRF